MKKNIIFLILILSFLILNRSLLIGIEVGGHISEDTTWSPENNPYLVTENLYVDPGVTLTIAPGTEIKISGAQLTSYYDNNENFTIYNGDSVAKMIWVNGRIIAKGTEQDSIIFDRIQDDINYNWGSIYMTENAGFSIFEHCIVRNAAGIWVAVSVPTKGLCFENGKGIVRKCRFINNGASIYSISYTKELEICDNIFIIDENVNPFLPHYNYGRLFIATVLNSEDDPSQKSLISNNKFYGTPFYVCMYASHFLFSYNKIDSCSHVHGAGYYFGNEFTNCEIGISEDSNGDSLYIKNNRFIGGNKGIDVDYTYVEISDNYLEGCGVDTGFEAIGKIFNNKINEGSVFIGTNIFYYNNIITNYFGSNCALAGYKVHDMGNIIINNEIAFNDNNDTLHTNSIILQNEELFWSPIQHGTDTFRNCIIDFPLEPPLIDGGGNIIVDSLQAQSIFEDIQNGDFHLATGSIAIDAGFDTTGYYYPFDMDYHKRVWDGDNDGNAVIDIGAYEYGAPQLGKIVGNITETNSGEPVNYVLLKMNNEPGNFTFADSSGHFEIQLPAGTYDIYAERIFYEDNVIYGVTVEDEQTTEVNFNMTSTLPPVSINEYEFIINNSELIISNYPNPFNPETTISFNLAQASKVSLTIYNIKGQKVKTLLNTRLEKGEHSIVWDGTDNRGKKVASGLYLYKITSGKEVAVRKMMLLK